MKEAARSSLDVDLLAQPCDVQAVERLHGAVRLALRRTERGEVVASDQHRRAFVHRLHLERHGDVPNPSGVIFDRQPPAGHVRTVPLGTAKPRSSSSGLIGARPARCTLSARIAPVPQAIVSPSPRTSPDLAERSMSSAASNLIRSPLASN